MPVFGVGPIPFGETGAKSWLDIDGPGTVWEQLYLTKSEKTLVYQRKKP